MEEPVNTWDHQFATLDLSFRVNFTPSKSYLLFRILSQLSSARPALVLYYGLVCSSADFAYTPTLVEALPDQ